MLNSLRITRTDLRGFVCRLQHYLLPLQCQSLQQ
uniref:Uncharacterized protein n=1 Tax=Arundo donax TaxID=35708 RepID=A0A0A8ZP16_ARUDO